MLLKLLKESARLTLKTARHCIAYCLPSLALLAAGLHFLWTGAAPVAALFCFAAFLFFNTLFVYALCGEMMKGAAGDVCMAPALTWHRRHGDFLLFVALGLLAAAAAALFFFDMTALVFEQVHELRDKQAQAVAAQGARTMQSRSIGLQASGAAAVAYALLTTALLLWSFFCRAGLRVPAHVAGYYMRTEEAMELTYPARFSATAVSLLFLAGAAAVAEALALELELGGLPGGDVVAAVTGYFLALALHVALWTCLYFALVKSTGYQMAGGKRADAG